MFWVPGPPGLERGDMTALCVREYGPHMAGLFSGVLGSDLRNHVPGGAGAAITGDVSEVAALSPLNDSAIDYSAGGKAAHPSPTVFNYIHQTQLWGVFGVATRPPDIGAVEGICGNASTDTEKGFMVAWDDAAGGVLRAHVFRGQAGVSAVVAGGSVAVGARFSFGLICDASTLRLYVDGVEVDSVAAIPTVTGDASNAFEVGSVGGGAHLFHGVIGEIAMVCRSVLAKEIEVYHARSMTGL